MNNDALPLLADQGSVAYKTNIEHSSG